MYLNILFYLLHWDRKKQQSRSLGQVYESRVIKGLTCNSIYIKSSPVSKDFILIIKIPCSMLLYYHSPEEVSLSRNKHNIKW